MTNITQPLPYTMLSLSRWAKIMGINPVHFWGGTAENLATPIVPIKSSCGTIWFQYEWQDDDKVSRYEIAQAIESAEFEIAQALGWFPAPMWVYGEEHQYPRVYRREYFGTGGNPRGLAKSVNTRFGKIIEIGRRATTLIDTATKLGGELVYSDEDTDGFYETATITVATALTDVKEIKIFHTGYNGHPGWEIRTPRSITIAGGNVTIVVDAWLLIDPTLYEFYPTDQDSTAIDLSTINNYVESVEVRRVYTDTTENSAEFYWENADVGCASCSGAGCEACGQVTQSGCARIRSAEDGILSALPASYDSDTGLWTTAASWSGYREPDRLKLWYYAGDRTYEYLNDLSLDPLPMRMAMAIAYMATARLDRTVCSCTNVEDKYEKLSRDVTEGYRESSFFVTEDGRWSSFGTRFGEIQAHRLIFRGNVGRRSRVAVL